MGLVAGEEAHEMEQSSLGGGVQDHFRTAASPPLVHPTSEPARYLFISA